ncbi:Hypothetical protein SRAE_X000000100 [Strongyloides ratti]|uniref:Uncharacterized protein n=1 Tax=Strongyloides ratti TaxID=34506 RepID=A0A090LLI5_STRRB|nr:Hypothetical protein SRAE_X000000100 [Strongyloides ratti]CEF70670.1 Hypothetical protein SRAE_X000000100 [Strongyloides ratti]
MTGKILRKKNKRKNNGSKKNGGKKGEKQTEKNQIVFRKKINSLLNETTYKKQDIEEDNTNSNFLLNESYQTTYSGLSDSDSETCNQELIDFYRSLIPVVSYPNLSYSSSCSEFDYSPRIPLTLSQLGVTRHPDDITTDDDVLTDWEDETESREPSWPCLIRYPDELTTDEADRTDYEEESENGEQSWSHLIRYPDELTTDEADRTDYEEESGKEDGTQEDEITEEKENSTYINKKVV